MTIRTKEDSLNETRDDDIDPISALISAGVLAEELGPHYATCAVIGQDKVVTQPAPVTYGTAFHTPTMDTFLSLTRRTSGPGVPTIPAEKVQAMMDRNALEFAALWQSPAFREFWDSNATQVAEIIDANK